MSFLDQKEIGSKGNDHDDNSDSFEDCISVENQETGTKGEKSNDDNYTRSKSDINNNCIQGKRGNDTTMGCKNNSNLKLRKGTDNSVEVETNSRSDIFFEDVKTSDALNDVIETKKFYVKNGIPEFSRKILDCKNNGNSGESSMDEGIKENRKKEGKMKIKHKDSGRSKDKQKNHDQNDERDDDKAKKRGSCRGKENDRVMHKDMKKEIEKEKSRKEEREKVKNSEKYRDKEKRKEKCKDLEDMAYSKLRKREKAKDSDKELKKDRRRNKDRDRSRSKGGCKRRYVDDDYRGDKYDRGKSSSSRNNGLRSPQVTMDSCSRYRRSSSYERCSRYSSRGMWRFDSPPKEYEVENTSSLNSSTAEGLAGTNATATSAIVGTEESSLDTVNQEAVTAASSAAVASGVNSTSDVFPVQENYSIVDPNYDDFVNKCANVPSSSSLLIDPAAIKAARELYVGNLPRGLDVSQLLEFLNAAMLALKANVLPGNAASKAWISTDGHYAFVEFRTMEEASNCMQLTGLNCLGHALRIGRPKTYPAEFLSIIPPPTVCLLDSSYLSRGIEGVHIGVAAAASMVNLSGYDSGVLPVLQSNGSIPLNGIRKPDRLCLTNLPPHLPEEKVRELMKTFGPLRYLKLLTKEDSSSAGICICDFEDYESQVQAINILSQNTNYGIMKAEDAVIGGLLGDFLTKQLVASETLVRPQIATKILMLCNLVVISELSNDQVYEEIIDDVRVECSRYGAVESLLIPRASNDQNINYNEDECNDGVGYAFVEFSSVDGCAKARKALSGRKFDGRVVEAHYFNEFKYKNRDFKDPSPNYEALSTSTVLGEISSEASEK